MNTKYQVFKGELSFYPLTWILFNVPCLEISTTVRWIITVFCHIKQKNNLFTPHRLFFSVTAGLQSQHDLEPMLGISAVYDIIGIQE